MGKLLGKISDLKSQIKFLQDTNILPSTQTCIPCNTVLNKMCNEGSFVYFRCGKCKKRVSIRKGTVLWNSKLSLRRFILLVYCTTGHTSRWITRCASNSPSQKLSPTSINCYATYFREIIADHIIESEKVQIILRHNR